MTILITGGAGFIGYNFINLWLRTQKEKIVNIDKNKYTELQKKQIISKKNLFSYHSNISDKKKINFVLNKFKPRAIIHFAAETHVDRSIKNPIFFFKNNIFQSSVFLQIIYEYWLKKNKKDKIIFKFINVSTDEVYGHLKLKDKSFTEKSIPNPRNPYSASKSSFDFICNSYFTTFKFPVITTHCSNNFGPFQKNEKLIPLVITNALKNKSLPIYGNGKQIRDWLFVEDHCSALMLILKKAKAGKKYNIGGNNEKQNIKLVYKICEILDILIPKENNKSYNKLINFVDDRLGHDKRYSINSNKLKKDLNWSAKKNFDQNLRKTINWYINNFK